MFAGVLAVTLVGIVCSNPSTPCTSSIPLFPRLPQIQQQQQQLQQNEQQEALQQQIRSLQAMLEQQQQQQRHQQAISLSFPCLSLAPLREVRGIAAVRSILVAVGMPAILKDSLAVCLRRIIPISVR